MGFRPRVPRCLWNRGTFISSATPIQSSHTSYFCLITCLSIISLNPQTVVNASADLTALKPDHKPDHKKPVRFTSHGKPKPKERDLDPTEDIPNTAADAMVTCRWGTCKGIFRAETWALHAKSHRTERYGMRVAGTHQAVCLWKGCMLRMSPRNMDKHVRAQHVGTYKYRCKHCAKTARGDSYVGTHGLARDCPRRPGASPTTTTSAAASPAWSSSGSSAMSSDRHSLRYSPYHRSNFTPSESPEVLDDYARPVLPFLAKSLRRGKHQSARVGATPAFRAAGPPSEPPILPQPAFLPPVFLPPIAHPRPIRIPQLQAFDWFSQPPLVPDVPAFPDTPSTDQEPSPPMDPSAVQQAPILDRTISAAEYSVFCAVADASFVFDASLVFDKDAPWGLRRDDGRPSARF